MRGLEQVPWAYDLLVALFEAAGLAKWRVWLAREAVGRTLDLGCGTGRSLPLYPAGSRPIGLDPEMRLLLRARKRAASVPLVLGRAEALPFAPCAFETVAVSLVFCSVVDPPKGLSEIRRVLAPGGTLRMMEHVRPEGLSGRLADLVQPAWTCLAGGCHPNRRTEAAVARAGFAIDPSTRRTTRTLRRFVARPVAPS
jgi:ubiquinone/menaquinone biosynthesis C-methylase UbiE